MRRLGFPRLLLASVVLLLVPAAACAGEAEPEAVTEEEPVLTGRVTREEIEASVPGWVRETVEAEVNQEAARDLAAVDPGARVTVFLGTWCSDSRREVPRFWSALDRTGGAPPFEVAYVGVDRSKEEPAELVAGHDLRYVPTFVVRRSGREVGRVVESAPHGIEIDLLALLAGEASGILTGRDDLENPPAE